MDSVPVEIVKFQGLQDGSLSILARVPAEKVTKQVEHALVDLRGEPAVIEAARSVRKVDIEVAMTPLEMVEQGLAMAAAGTMLLRDAEQESGKGAESAPEPPSEDEAGKSEGESSQGPSENERGLDLISEAVEPEPEANPEAGPSVPERPEDCPGTRDAMHEACEECKVGEGGCPPW